MKRAIIVGILAYSVGVGVGAAMWREKSLRTDDAELAWVKALGQLEVCRQDLRNEQGKY
jgi:hypothetical protein